MAAGWGHRGLCRRCSSDDHTARYDGLLGALDALRTGTAHVGDAIAQLVGEVQDELGALLEMTDRDFAEAERLSHEELGGWREARHARVDADLRADFGQMCIGTVSRRLGTS